MDKIAKTVMSYETENAVKSTRGGICRSSKGYGGAL